MLLKKVKTGITGAIVFTALALWPTAIARASEAVSVTQASTAPIDSSAIPTIATGYTVDEGLPQSSIKDILQARDGYLWIATQEGLARFDGLRFSVYNTRNAPGLVSNNIHQIIEDGEGDLWLLAGSGLTRYHNGVFQNMTPQSDRTGDRINYLFHGADGKLYAASDSSVMRGDAAGLVPLASTKGFLTGGPWYFAQQSDGTVWISGAGRRIVSIQGSIIRRYTVPGKTGDELGGLTVDRSGTVWVAASGLWRVDAAGTLSRFPVAEIAPGRHVDALSCDPSGDLWLTMQGGVFSVVPGQSHAHFRAAPNLPSRWCAFEPDGTIWQLLPNHGHDIIWCFANGRVSLLPVPGRVTTEWTLPVHRGAEGTIWVGTYSGLDEFRPGRCRTFGKEAGLTEGDVRAAYQTHDGAIWMDLGGANFGALRNGRFQLSGDPNLRQGNVSSMAEDADGALWVATYTGRLWRSTVQTGSDRSPAVDWRWAMGGENESRIKPGAPVGQTPSSNELPVTALARGNDGGVWCSDGVRLVEFVHGKVAAGYRLPLDSPLAGQVFVIHQTHDGRIWIGGEKGFACLDHGRFRYFGPETGIPSVPVIDICEDHTGEIWLAFWGGGLGRFRHGKISVVTLRDGLYSDSIQSVLEDRNGDLWMSTSNGIFCVRRTELDTYFDGGRQAASFSCRVVGREDGADGVQYEGGRQPVAFKAMDGSLWFCSLTGMVQVLPSEPTIRSRRTIPVAIEAAVIDGHAFHASGADAAPGAGDLEFDYTAITFHHASKVEFKYRLDGFDRSWIAAGDRRVAYYTHVPPGSYRFEVSARDADGNWTTDSAVFQFSLRPHYYETTWFRVLMFIALVFTITGAVMAYFYRLKLQNRLLEERVQERTRDLAYANRDLSQSREEVIEQNAMLQSIQAELEAQNQELEDSRALLAEQNEQLHEMQMVLKLKNQSLAEANSRLEDLATIDGLTGLKNHRSFQVKLDAEIKFAARHLTPLSMIILDVDSFKSYNDTYGHPAGDEVLKQVARILSEAARDSDFVARYGGEEFVVILPVTDSHGAAGVAERLRSAIEAWPWTVRPITASFGVAMLTLDIGAAAEFVDRADRALYSSKQNGKNRVTQYHELVVARQAR